MTSDELGIELERALSLHRAGRTAEAESGYRGILSHDPSHAGALQFLGVSMCQSGQTDTGLELLHRAANLRPDRAEIHFNLGNALRGAGQLDQALAAYATTLSLNPTFFQAHYNQGYIYRAQNRSPEAIAAFTLALQHQPNFPQAAWNLALTFLLSGDFERGWPAYESRWRMYPPTYQIVGTQWRGERFEGRTLLLHAEQGIGDTIQFIRYVPQVVARGGRVILVCRDNLVPLLANVPGISHVASTVADLPPFDLHIPLLSLPLIFATRIDSIPAKKSYIQPDDELTRTWANRLADGGGKLRIGLAWAGSPTHIDNLARSLSIERLTPILLLPDTKFESLQKGPAATEHSPFVTDHAADLRNFADTAALIANLDLVISVDTAVAHLAAAMGKPTWVMLPFAPDWRWMLGRDDSPWYPTMRLFRQPVAGDWDSVIHRIRTELETKLTQDRPALH